MGSLTKTAIKTASGKDGLAGLGTTFGLLFVRYCLRKPGLQAYLGSLLDRVFPSGNNHLAMPAEVIRNADCIINLFRERGFVPSKLAVDGLPGSGKSSLAAALAGELGMDAVCLDHRDMDQPLDFTRCNAVYEHHRLLRTQDVDAFDAIIYIDEQVDISDEQVDISRQRVLMRKRGGYLVEILDYALLKRIGDKAFSIAEGERVSLAGSPLHITFRPGRGFRCRERIRGELVAQGHDADGLTKEQALFLLVEGAPRGGFKAYLNIHTFDHELRSALTESVLLSGRGRGLR